MDKEAKNNKLSNSETRKSSISLKPSEAKPTKKKERNRKRKKKQKTKKGSKFEEIAVLSWRQKRAGCRAVRHKEIGGRRGGREGEEGGTGKREGRGRQARARTVDGERAVGIDRDHHLANVSVDQAMAKAQLQIVQKRVLQVVPRGMGTCARPVSGVRESQAGLLLASTPTHSAEASSQ